MNKVNPCLSNTPEFDSSLLERLVGYRSGHNLLNSFSQSKDDSTKIRISVIGTW